MNDEKPGGPIRIGDKEREDAVRRLGEHYEAGRLSAEEHTERVGQALEAKTEADLKALFSDLPGEYSSAPSGAGPQFGPGRPPWAVRGALGKVPFPVLIALAAIALIVSFACVVGGGHPPFLPLLLIVAAVVIMRKREQERRA
ncbi:MULTISPECIES: DUF1707 SHOCT-like domain-containing protein [unclassified Kribbella]|uniref:DUF1707 SHOCT-like domain-containing protein n=1 Tax=unclassified Kribbella TaxID=2644121 RepID=UPI0030198266